MVDVLTKKQRRYNMSQIKSRDTKPEISLRKIFRKEGLKGYRLHPEEMIGKPDIIFSKQKIAIFIDGCQWHKCQRHYVEPKTNTSFWIKKIEGNVKRDKFINKVLKKDGWKVIRIWEHDLKKKELNKTIPKIIKVLKKRKND